ncbi:hypothetical protein GCM10025734_75480 [Kitasatospora paranensis]
MADRVDPAQGALHHRRVPDVPRSKTTPSGYRGAIPPGCTAGSRASSTLTPCPSRANCRATADPMNPAPPVSRISMPPTLVRPEAGAARARPTVSGP